MCMYCYDRLIGEDDEDRSRGGLHVYTNVETFTRYELKQLSSAVEVALTVSICKYFCLFLLWFNIHSCAMRM